MLNAENLSKRFGDVKAVKDLSLKMENGEIVGLLGPNGAGKTTTMQMLSGLLKPDSGNIDVENSLRKDVVIVLQETNYGSKLKVEEFLNMMSVLNENVFSVDNAISKAGLEEDREKFVENLSGGTKKKLNIAAGLLKNPNYLLLDEPTAGLDPRAKRKIRETVEKLAEDKSALVSTHSMEEAQKLCDRIIIIENGEEIVSGSPEELIKKVESDYIIKAEGSVPTGFESKAIKTDDFFEIKSDRPHEILKELVESGAIDELENLTVEKPGLEEVFLEITGRRYNEKDN